MRRINYETDFNTSNVTIYLFPPLQPIILIFISIHLMLLFTLKTYLFIYIRAAISIHLMLLFTKTALTAAEIRQQYFNTSNVTIYHMQVYKLFTIVINFNTSNVTIYQTALTAAEIRQQYFNTSNVTIYLLPGLKYNYFLRHFNTSNVTIYRISPSLFPSIVCLFQYI